MRMSMQYHQGLDRHGESHCGSVTHASMETESIRSLTNPSLATGSDDTILSSRIPQVGVLLIMNLLMQ